MSSSDVGDIREKILNATRLQRMRLGQHVGEPVEIDLGNDEKIRALQVPLTEAEVQQGVILASQINAGENMTGLMARNRVSSVSDVWNSLRHIGEPTKKVFESIEEMMEVVDSAQTNLLIDSLAMLMDYASPSIDGFTDEELNEAKKAFAAIDWSALSGRQWAAVKQSCLVLIPDQLQGKLSGSSSTD